MTENTHPNLAAALAAFQAEAPTFKKGNEAKVGSYSYWYADLGGIVPIVNPLMAKHGLSWSAKPGRADDGDQVLRYTLRHVSGESDVGEMSLGVGPRCKPQELGSAITYARRYALTAQLNLVTDADDDGGIANQRERPAAPRARAQPTAQPAQDSERPASAAQRGKINAKANEGHVEPSVLASIILVATGNDLRDFANEEAAASWLKRALERLPARCVDDVLKNIEAESR